MAGRSRLGTDRVAECVDPHQALQKAWLDGTSSEKIMDDSISRYQ